jgi:predicted short-subunit dehydrogenase-like oxidoreductase (DUF2520 family)
MSGIQNVVLIGSGNVATHLAEICIAKDFNIQQVFSKNIEHAKTLATRYHTAAINDPQELILSADLYIIAVKDDAIAELNGTLRIPDKIVVHTSGTASIEAIKDISGRTGVFYPLQTFTKYRSLHWQTIPICIEGSDYETINALGGFALEISDAVFSIDSASRRRLHLAAVFVNNFGNYLLGQAKEIVGEDLPFSILHPLAIETIEKAFDMAPDQAQTGPAIRGDQKTIDVQLKSLEANPAATELYNLFNKLIREKYKK